MTHGIVTGGVAEAFAALADRGGAAAGEDRMLDALIKQAIDPEAIVLFHPGNVRTKRDAERGRLADFPVEDFTADPEGVAMHVEAGR